MKLYLAGNFPVMSSLEKETAMKDFIYERGYSDYMRLVSFYYKEYGLNVIRMKENGSKRIDKVGGE